MLPISYNRIMGASRGNPLYRQGLAEQTINRLAVYGSRSLVVTDSDLQPARQCPPSVVLSPSQQAIVDHRGQYLQVIACAGSGKTESISRRVAALIRDGDPPESIVAFTFTE